MATYIRLTDYKNSDEKEQEFFNPHNRYDVEQKDFRKIPGEPLIYWIPKQLLKSFKDYLLLNKYARAAKGLVTANNDEYVRLWYEIALYKVGFNYNDRTDAKKSQKKWFPYAKGGAFRRWYGNFDAVVNWENDGYLLQNTYTEDGKRVRATNFNIDRIFKEGISWTVISSGKQSFRYVPKGFLFDAAAGICQSYKISNSYILGILNSHLSQLYLDALNPTLNLHPGYLESLPIGIPNHNINQQIISLVQQNIDISKEEWDSRETSWDFATNPLLQMRNEKLAMSNEESSKIEDAYNAYCDYWREKFFRLHANEEELNRLFIDIYELQDELTPDVPLEDITILKNEAKIVDGELVFQADEIMKQFISYGVGVMFGRYSLDSDGLLIANMGQEVPTDTTFEIDDDNVIPVLEEDYFKDDIASRFVQFVKTAFGEEHLSENIKFIEDSLGTPLRKYFVKGFYEDHIKRYKKRPIYWMVASPKKGFMSLIYMHRYEPDTFARVRNSYLTEYIAKLEAHKETLHLTITSETASNKDKKDADKQSKNIEAKLKEVIAFDREKMMSVSQNPVEIDLDDGVKVNYCKFRDILYPITGLCK